MSFLNFDFAKWYSVMLAAAAAGMLVWFTVRGEIKTVEDILFKLVTNAEMKYPGGTGELKRAEVIEKIFLRLPPLLRCLISEERLSDMVEQALKKAKEIWQNNHNLSDYIQKNK